MTNREDEIKLLAEYLLRLLSEQEDEKINKEESVVKKMTLAEAAAQKTMKELKEAYGVEADVIRAIIKRANEIKRERTDYTVSKPLWNENFDKLID